MVGYVSMEGHQKPRTTLSAFAGQCAYTILMVYKLYNLFKLLPSSFHVLSMEITFKCAYPK